ncbi:chromosome partitioning protein [Flavimobilis marinus]|uniref:non-specific protein-tyrosine kinase n=1 Tax=Flavimobilis marinus TaxID=285351 RepID=A0A1I2GS79_9MICO|nr:polysaccharide biosynthesis tyrosine autokinase [Flavimobilis marinus]GHG55687.1 chromosome partitioning protein [Flavimobilis marinus]SFF19687.1 capsular exopolysaccharide family [Flavimobilis marinus]
MELQDYVAILRKRWVSILLITLACVGAAVGATMLMTPTYEARAQVYVSVRTGGTTSDLVQGSNFTQNQVKSYTDLVTSPRVLQPVIDEFSLPVTSDELAESVSASSPLGTALINISVSDPDARAASDIANAVADSLATEVTALEKPVGEVSPVQVSTTRGATPPEDPASPSLKLNLALGLLVGLAAGLGYAVLRHVLDTKVRTDADIAQVTDASVIGTIAYDNDAPEHPLIVQTDPHSLRAEAFRRLRTNLQFLDVEDRSNVTVITSSVPGEGKTTTSINLAATVADAGQRVLLIDADMRRPSVAKYMGIEGHVGLTTVLIGRATMEDVVQPFGAGSLDVLAAGQTPPNPSELLGSGAMGELLERASAAYDVVIIDTPPLLPVTDATILARRTGGAIVVVGAERIQRAQLAESLSSLETAGARALGVVLNRAKRTKSDSYSYYDYRSDLAPSAKSNKTRTKPAKARRSTPAEPSFVPPAPATAPRHVPSRSQQRGAARPSWPPLQ